MKTLVLEDLDLSISCGKVIRHYGAKIGGDIYESPETVQVRTTQAAIEALKSEPWDYLVLDNDLGLYDVRDGFRVLDWLEEAVAAGKYPYTLPRILTGTANDVARERMLVIIRRIEDLKGDE